MGRRSTWLSHFSNIRLPHSHACLPRPRDSTLHLHLTSDMHWGWFASVDIHYIRVKVIKLLLTSLARHPDILHLLKLLLVELTLSLLDLPRWSWWKSISKFGLWQYISILHLSLLHLLHLLGVYALHTHHLHLLLHSLYVEQVLLLALSSDA